MEQIFFLSCQWEQLYAISSLFSQGKRLVSLVTCLHTITKPVFIHGFPFTLHCIPWDIFPQCFLTHCTSYYLRYFRCSQAYPFQTISLPLLRDLRSCAFSRILHRQRLPSWHLSTYYHLLFTYYHLVTFIHGSPLTSFGIVQDLFTQVFFQTLDQLSYNYFRCSKGYPFIIWQGRSWDADNRGNSALWVRKNTRETAKKKKNRDWQENSSVGTVGLKERTLKQ